MYICKYIDTHLYLRVCVYAPHTNTHTQTNTTGEGRIRTVQNVASRLACAVGWDKTVKKWFVNVCLRACVCVCVSLWCMGVYKSGQKDTHSHPHVLMISCPRTECVLMTLYTSRTQFETHTPLHVLMSRCRELNVCWWLYTSRTQLDTHVIRCTSQFDTHTRLLSWWVDVTNWMCVDDSTCHELN